MKRLAAVLVLGVAGGFLVGNHEPPSEKPAIEFYEDGSGVQYDENDQDVRTFPEGTFWVKP